MPDQDRYFLTDEREVTKAAYVAAERRAGFRNTMGQPDEPATAAWSAGRTSGRIQYGRAAQTRDEEDDDA